MKRSVALLLPLLLSACSFAVPAKNERAAIVPENRPVTTASYMGDQEKELKLALTGTPFKVVRFNNILVVTLSGEDLFKDGQSELTPSADEALKKIAPVFSRYKKTRISIIGHADSGQPSLDGKISEKRAQSVAGALKKSAKIADIRFWIESGNSNLPSSDHEQNNFVDIILTPTFIQ